MTYIVVKNLAIPVILCGIATGVVSGSVKSFASQPVAAQEIITVVATPEPTPSPTPSQVPSPTPSPEPKDLYRTHFGKEAHIARAIAKAENHSGDPKAKNTNRDGESLPNKPWKDNFPNGSEDYGLMQINLFWNWNKIPGDTKQEKIDWIVVPENNIKLAKQIRDSWGNFSAWSTYKSGKYKHYLGKE